MKKINIISTIGPSSLNKRTIEKMDESGVDIFRINLSHTAFEDYKEVINNISSWTDKPIYTDIEGAQLRIGKLQASKQEIDKNSMVRFSFHSNKGDIIPLYPRLNENIFSVGDMLFIDFKSVVVQITEIANEIIHARAISGGMIGSNKGIGTDRILRLPFITQKDRDIIELSIQMRQKHFCLSFASSGEDVLAFRNLFPYEIQLISKIENRRGIENLKEICKISDEILIDRGDLSRDIELSTIAFAQKEITIIASTFNTPVNVATNLLESMITNNEPTRAEISDITNALIDGASGLVLAAETAIGSNPINSVKIVKRVINKFSYFLRKMSTGINADLLGELISPHGGALVKQYLKNVDIREDILMLPISKNVIADCFQIGEGTYSPLTGFMCMDEVHSVLANDRLLDGNSWPLPIILQVDDTAARRIKGVDVIAFKDDVTDRVLAILENVKVEKIGDLSKIARSWFLTDSTAHPGVERLYNSGEYIISGKVSIVNKPSEYIKPYELTPAQARRVFLEHYWTRIVGFHTRNIPHKAHEYIQKAALEKSNADALFISPVLGNMKQGDFNSEAIITGYKALINADNYGPYGVFLGGINTYSRFSGHREAVFTAICRQNYGCTHFVVGRDHAGINDYYSGVDIEKYFKKFPDLNIRILFFNEVVFDEDEKIYCELDDSCDIENNQLKISGTLCREYLEKQATPPEYLISSEVAQAILKLPSIINE